MDAELTQYLAAMEERISKRIDDALERTALQSGVGLSFGKVREQLDELQQAVAQLHQSLAELKGEDS